MNGLSLDILKSQWSKNFVVQKKTCRLKHSQMKGYVEERSLVFSTSSLLTLLWPAILRPIKCQCSVDIFPCLCL